MLLNRNNLAVRHLALTEGETNRAVFTGCLITSRGTVATDGYRMVRVEIPQDKDDDFPTISGMNPVNGKPVSVLVPGETFKAAEGSLKAAKKFGKSMPILGNVQIGLDGSRVQMGATDLRQPTITSVQPLDEQFFDYQRVYPTDPPAFSIAWSLSTFAKIAKVLGALDIDEKAASVKMHFWGPERAAYLTVQTKQGQLVEFVAMPALPTDNRSVAPTWERPADWTKEPATEVPAIEPAQATSLADPSETEPVPTIEPVGAH